MAVLCAIHERLSIQHLYLIYIFRTENIHENDNSQTTTHTNGGQK